mmetsp:Transcript_26214/g.39493  ORF Transcript_26214/g.39493 Transcript_26214/m.39493 type:complete len:174 (-) Transcript_26214:83-604(-)
MVKCNGGFFTLLLLASMTSVVSSFSIVSMVLSRVNPAVESTPTQSLPINDKELHLNVPDIRLSHASTRGLNTLYSPRDPKTIPKGFIRACGKAGGFAPRPLWDDLTTGVTPWFENKQGCFIYFNCNDSHWWIDSEQGSGMYLAAPNGSLLLPPTDGWMTLTGERAGAPTMSFD